MHELSACFMRVYNSIPTEFQLPLGDAQLRYVESFDNNFSLLLRERISMNLYPLMRDTIEVELNLMALGKIQQRFNRGGNKP